MPARDNQIFVNCPYDKPFKPLFDALVFAIHDLGFQAVYGLNAASGGPIRLRRIETQLLDCRYSIHDISRVELSGVRQLPRFNMPFEAGMAYALNAYRPGGLVHDLLLLDEKRNRYQASLSDAAGMDPKIHGGDQFRAIAAVREFLKQQNPTLRLNQADYVQRRFATFHDGLPGAAKAARINLSELRSWPAALDLQQVMADWIRDNP